MYPHSGKSTRSPHRSAPKPRPRTQKRTRTQATTRTVGDRMYVHSSNNSGSSSSVAEYIKTSSKHANSEMVVQPPLVLWLTQYGVHFISATPARLATSEPGEKKFKPC